ncbi:MAG: hypothetical protein EAX96_04570 [Candidatus Lokiarchaeota archaeon]|nr:hypothetical protein [Candidatus Lokiarchaeota archaeon]
MLSILSIDPILSMIGPILFLGTVALATIIASWCAMLSKDVLAILASGIAIEFYACFFNLFYQNIYQVNLYFVIALTIFECGMIGFFMIIKLYWAWTDGWHKLKKGQFKTTTY